MIRVLPVDEKTSEDAESPIVVIVVYEGQNDESEKKCGEEDER